MFSSIVAFSLIAEIVLMIFVPKPIVWLDPQESYVHHPKLIHKLKPNQNSFTHSFTVTTNSYGLRNQEFPLKPNPGIFRILALGDSLTFGNGVQAQDTYPKQLESMLNLEGRQKYKVINAGAPGYDTWQEVTYLREYGWKFKPRLVIIGFYANDIVPRPRRIPQIINESGFKKKQGIQGLFSYKAIHLLKRSRVLLLLRDRYQKLVNRISPSAESRHKLSLLNGTADPFIESGWKEVESSLKELLDLGKKHDFSLLLVLFPMPDQLITDYPHATYPTRLKAIAHKYKIHFVDLMQVFKENFNGFGSLFIEGDGHPNAKAYTIAAREITKYLLERHIVISECIIV